MRRSRHGKRLPQLSDDGQVANGGFVQPPPPATPPAANAPPTPAEATPTTTVFVDSNGNTVTAVTAPQSLTISLPSPAPSPATPAPSVVVISSPSPASPATQSATHEHGSSSDKGTSNQVNPHGIPIGSIVGIVLTAVIILIAIGVFVFRRRSVRKRMKLRAWGNKNTAPSFLWVENKSFSSENYGETVAPFASPRTQSRLSPEPSFAIPRPPPQVLSAYQPSNNGLPYVPPPAPPRPPPAHGYEYNPRAPATSAAPITPGPVPSTPATPASASTVRSANLRLPVPDTPASMLSPLTPGTMPPLPTLPSPTPIPPTNLPSPMSLPVVPPTSIPVMATIRSTFIPTLPDELTISTGEVIRIRKEFDDGWALCVNVRGEQGMVPLECLDRGNGTYQGGEQKQFKKLARASSLAARSYGGIV